MPSTYTTPAGRFIATTQAAANQAAANYACQQARAAIQQNCPQAITDMPLDQAVYVPAAGGHGAYIAAVRNGYVFNFNATTGAKVASVCFAPTIYGPSTIVYEPVNDVLVVGTSGEWGGWFGSANGPGKGLFKINPTSLATTLHLTAYSKNNTPSAGGAHVSDLLLGDARDGIYQMYVNGGIVYGTLFSFQASTTFGGSLFLFDPSTNGFQCYAGSPTTQQENSKMIIVGGVMLINGAAHDLSTFNYTTDLSEATGYNFLPSATTSGCAYGMCNPPSGNIYIVDRSALIYKVNAALNVNSSVSLGAGNTGAINCRYNSVDQLIYVPCPASNKIVVYDPSTDAVVTTKVGFDSPHDVVFTPTTKWAVQHGIVGLQAIV